MAGSKQSGTDKEWLKILIIAVVAAAMVVAVFFRVTSRHGSGEEDVMKLTDVQKLTATDLTQNYPASTTAVLDYYYRIYRTLYSGACTEEEIQQLARQIRLLYDEELENKNPESMFVSQIQSDVTQKKEDGITLVAYVIPSASDINETRRTDDQGRDVVTAKNVSVTMSKGSTKDIIKYSFYLRRDQEGHWKILGWVNGDDPAAAEGGAGDTGQ